MANIQKQMGICDNFLQKKLLAALKLVAPPDTFRQRDSETATACPRNTQWRKKDWNHGCDVGHVKPRRIWFSSVQKMIRDSLNSSAGRPTDKPALTSQSVKEAQTHR